eukprot:Blabericola_migrator_1__6128@NODE_3095_length_2040_cov_42_733908_g1937_i0_p1_GENE_NODE_3095_length_2040_cov_42_733908_g1937_i0NODE_3095_length_2040_cov_42_733908_g1937_i0_p1_ORF_typecomplete_len116_score16_22rve/PF00665_26/1_4e09DDE_2/PF02914_15/4_2e05_NODE_3095_length_2040_cov_42_733908_g1937_i0461808
MRPRQVGGTTFHTLVVVDHVTRFMRADVGEHPPTAAVTRQVFTGGWIQTHGAPRAILTDNGTTFAGSVFSEWVRKSLKTAPVLTSTHYPQGNAINEAHRVIEKSLMEHYQLKILT